MEPTPKIHTLAPPDLDVQGCSLVTFSARGRVSFNEVATRILDLCQGCGIMFHIDRTYENDPDAPPAAWYLEIIRTPAGSSSTSGYVLRPRAKNGRLYFKSHGVVAQAYEDHGQEKDEYPRLRFVLDPAPIELQVVTPADVMAGQPEETRTTTVYQLLNETFHP